MTKLYLLFFAMLFTFLLSRCKKETPPTYVVTQGEVPETPQPPTNTQPPANTPIVLSPAEILAATPGWWSNPYDGWLYLGTDGFAMWCDNKAFPEVYTRWALTTAKDSIIIAGDKAALRFLSKDKMEVSSTTHNYFRLFTRLDLPLITSTPIRKVTDAGEYTPLAIDKDDNLYYFSAVLRKRSKSGVVTAIANPQLFGNGYKAMFIDDLGRFYFQSLSDDKVARYDHLTKETKFYNIDFGQQGSSYNSVTVDRQGNIYYVYLKTKFNGSSDDVIAVNIKKLDPNGQISIVAGNGTANASPDGTLASELGMSPATVTVNSKGDIYYFEASNNTIRKIDHLTQRVVTIAGNGTEGIAGDGGPARSASLNYPLQMYVTDNDDVYVQERFMIRKFDAKTGTFGAIAGILKDKGDAFSIGMSQHATTVPIRPYNTVVDTEGNVFFTNNYNYIGLTPQLGIYKVDAK